MEIPRWSDLKKAGDAGDMSTMEDMASASASGPQKRHPDRVYSHAGGVYRPNGLQEPRTREDGKTDGGLYVTRVGSHMGPGRYSVPEAISENAAVVAHSKNRKRDVSDADSQSRAWQEMAHHIFSGQPLGSYVHTDADRTVDILDPALRERYPVDGASREGTFRHTDGLSPEDGEEYEEAEAEDAGHVDWDKARRDGVGMAELSYRRRGGGWHPSEGIILSPDAVTGDRPMYGYEFRPMKYSYDQYPWMHDLMPWLNGVDSPEKAVQRGEDMKWADRQILRSQGLGDEAIEFLRKDGYPERPIPLKDMYGLSQYLGRHGTPEDQARMGALMEALQYQSDRQRRYLRRKPAVRSAPGVLRGRGL